MKKQPEITTQTKQNFVDAFWSLYKTNKIENITVKQITDIAGYNRATFYRYFENVYQILEYIENALLKSIDTTFHQSVLNHSNDISVENFITEFNKQGEYISILFSEKGDPYFVSKYKMLIKKNVKFFLPNYSTKQDLILEASISAIISSIIYWYNNQDKISIEELAILLRKIAFLNQKTSN